MSRPETLEQAVAEVTSWLTAEQLADMQADWPRCRSVDMRMLRHDIGRRLRLWSTGHPLRGELPLPEDHIGPWADYVTGKVIEQLTGKELPRWRRMGNRWMVLATDKALGKKR